MTGVELPDYSWVFELVCIVISIAACAFVLKGTRLNDNARTAKILNFFSFKWWKNGISELPSEDYAARRMEERIKGMYKGFPKGKAKVSARKAMWNQRPHLKEDAHVCGFTEPGVWECRCGKFKCETFGNLCEAVGGTDATPDQKCGLITPDKWECNCGGGLSGEYSARLKYNEGAELLNLPIAPPDRPMRDRKAAIEHSRNK